MADSYNGHRDYYGVGADLVDDGGTKAVLVTSQKPHDQPPIVPDGDARGSGDASANSGAHGTGGSHAASSLTLAPDAVQKIEAAFDARFHNGIHPNDVARAETPAQEAAEKLADVVADRNTFHPPAPPEPPADPLGPGNPTSPIGVGHLGQDGLHGVPSVLTHLADSLAPAGHAADGTSNTITVAERGAIGADLGHTIPTSGFAAALSGPHGDLPPPDHGGGVIDPLPPHVADLHVASPAIDLSAVHLDHAPISPAVHFDSFHH